MTPLAILAIIITSLFTYSVVGVWMGRLYTKLARSLCCRDGTCIHCREAQMYAGIFWPITAAVLILRVGGILVLGTANLPRRIMARRTRRRSSLPSRILIPDRAVLTSEDYRKLMPMVRRFEYSLPVHEREG